MPTPTPATETGLAARPPAAAGRPHNLIVRMSDAEILDIDASAAAHHQVRSEWVREALRRAVRAQRRRERQDCG